MARLTILPAAVAAVLALTAGAVLAQETAPAALQAAEAGPGAQAPRVKPAMVRLDFGAGRKLEVSCGTMDLAACVETITPLADKVAQTPVHGDMRGKGPKPGKHERGERGKDRPGNPGEAPPPPPAPGEDAPAP